MSNITIRIDGDISDLLPAGVHIEAIINQSRMPADLKELHEAIQFIHTEEATAKGFTSAERVMNDRLRDIEKAIVSGLPADVKLEIANRANGTSNV